MEDAQGLAKAAGRKGQRSEVLRYRSDAARLQAGAADALRQALNREPRQFHALTELAHLELASMPPPTATNDETRDHLLTRAELALELLDRALEMIPDSPKAYNNRAIALLRMGIGYAQLGRKADSQESLQAALESSVKALNIEPERVKSWANKAYVLWYISDLPGAREAALKAHELDPSYSFDPNFAAALERAGTPLPARVAPAPE
jgi:tetratricopeptide (TPR) repeat protein